MPQTHVATRWIAAAVISLSGCSSAGDDDIPDVAESGGTANRGGTAAGGRAGSSSGAGGKAGNAVGGSTSTAGAGGGSGVGGSAQSGGAAGSLGQGGSISLGGTGGSQTGGSAGVPGGGSAGASNGGIGGASGGGSAGVSNGGSAGVSNGGSGGSGTSGSSFGGASGGLSTGGAGGGAAGSGSGGKSGAGGAAGMGGKAGSGGAAGTGGTAPAPGPYALDFVGNITTNDSVDTDGKTFSRHWNQITPENAGKWGSVQSSAGAAYNWRTLDAIYDYAQRNNVTFKQHTFIWGKQQPSGNIDQTAVKNWMTEFCRRYPNTKLIDVVNEPPPHTTPAYAGSIGGGTDGTWQWITNAFTWAHQACPNAVLIFNDYSTIEWASETTHFIGIVNKIKAAGAPIDAIGVQAHSLDAPEVTFATVQTQLARMYTETGLPIYVTEMDLSSTDDATQLRMYQQYFPLFRDSGYVKGITIWGWIYGKTWSESQYSGLVRNGSSRSAMTWLMQQLGRPAP